MNSVQEQVLETYQRFQRAMIDKDIPALYDLVTADKTFTHMSGRKQTKEQFFGEIEDGTLSYFKSVIHDPIITVEGDSANLKAQTTLTARVYGMFGTWTLPTDQNFCRIDGNWKLCD